MSYRVLQEFTTPKHRWRVGATVEKGDIDGRMTAEHLVEIGVLEEFTKKPPMPAMTVSLRSPPSTVSLDEVVPEGDETKEKSE